MLLFAVVALAVAFHMAFGREDWRAWRICRAPARPATRSAQSSAWSRC